MYVRHKFVFKEIPPMTKEEQAAYEKAKPAAAADLHKLYPPLFTQLVRYKKEQS